jgi:hypothetical protein
LTALGLLSSVLFEHPGYATGVAIGALFVFSAASGLSKTSSEVLFVGYLSGPFETVGDLASQYVTARKGLSGEVLARTVGVPALWAGGLFALAAGLLSRRDIDR